MKADRDRYLRLLIDALLDRHYLDNEVRLEYVTGLPPGTRPDPDSMRDPARTLEVRFAKLRASREAGQSMSDGKGASYNPYADQGRAALVHLERAMVDVVERQVPGDVAVCGPGRGGTGILLRAVMAVDQIDDRTLWMVDPFLATNGGTVPNDRPGRARIRADLNQVRDGFERFDLLDERVRFLQGPFRSSLADSPIGPLSLLHIGGDAGFDVNTIGLHLFPRVSPGGVIIVEGINRPIIEQRLAEAAETVGLRGHVERVDWNTVAWRVESPANATARPPDGPAVLHRVPLATPAPTDRVDLSVVVVFYDMVREAARTLQSLSRTYQQGIDDLSYEVIVLDNGSPQDRRVTAEMVAAYGPEFRLATVSDVRSSPTVALNQGIAESRGDVVAVMIDGAHVLTPGVFRHAMAAMGTYEPAVVAIQQWYVGPGQQGDAQQAGYEQQAEDRLFQAIKWPTDGYRLFEIGHFIGDRDWFDGIIESNCLFVGRPLLEQVGGFDDSFDMAGGGYANLELFERMHAHPGVTPVSVLGEGTFHQFHGGTTTNVADEEIRRARISSYGQHFRETRGRGLNGLNKPVHYVGAMGTKAARRTRSRREFLLSFDTGRDPVETTSAQPLPVAEELKFAAIEAVWDNQGWRKATWLGHPVARYPTDLQAYQELLWKVGPELAVLVSDDAGLGGRALHAATVMDSLGAGTVLAVGRSADDAFPTHPRITYIDGSDPAAAAVTVRELAGGRRAAVFIGLGAAEKVRTAFEAYSPLVAVGSYVVIENTVVNGRPTEPGFGPGPHEAVSGLLQAHPDFLADVAYESYTITFNKNGYLRRTRDP